LGLAKRQSYGLSHAPIYPSPLLFLGPFGFGIVLQVLLAFHAGIFHLLVVGFYLINIGFVTLALKSDAVVTTSRAAIELLSDKLGFVLLALGGMHFFNLFVFSRIRAHGQHNVPRRPPVAPDAVLKVAVPR